MRDAVEPRFVPAHGAGDPRYPPARDLSREPGEVLRAQGRIAVAAQDEVAAPDRPVERAEPAHLRVEAEAGPEQCECRVADHELLGRGGQQRQLGVAGEDDGACAQVDGDGGRPRRVQVRCRERAREPARQRRVAAGPPGGGAGDDERDERCEERREPCPAHAAAVSGS